MTGQDAVSYSAPSEQSVSPEVARARAFHAHFCALYAAVGRPLTEAQKAHSKRWIWRHMQAGAKPMSIAPEHVYRHPEATDAE